MAASPLEAPRKRSAAAREFAEIPRANRALAASRWAPVLPTFALAVAALAACGAKEEAGPERAPHATVRAADGVKVESAPATPPSRPGDEPAMAGLATPVVLAAPSGSVASIKTPPVVPVTTPATAVPTTPPIRMAGARAPTLPTAPATATTATTAAPVPSISPSYRPPTVKGKMPAVRPAPLDEDGFPPAASAPCPNPKGS